MAFTSMHLTNDNLFDIVIDTVRKIASNGLVERRRIIDRVEERIRELGAWEPTDDEWSQSADPKSIGRARIDFAISDLKRQGRLDNPSRDHWGLPKKSDVDPESRGLDPTPQTFAEPSVESLWVIDGLLSRITIDPAVCHGKPCVRGMRYPVEMLLDLLSSGMTFDEVLADYEDLEREDLRRFWRSRPASLEPGGSSRWQREVSYRCSVAPENGRLVDGRRW